jgi:hypothetical protein
VNSEQETQRRPTRLKREAGRQASPQSRREGREKLYETGLTGLAGLAGLTELTEIAMDWGINP